MAAVQNQYGSLIFCSRCGTLLDLPGDEDQLVCDGCGQVEDATGASPSRAGCACEMLTKHVRSLRGQGHHDQVEPGCFPLFPAATQDEPGQEPRRGREEEGLRACFFLRELVAECTG